MHVQQKPYFVEHAKPYSFIDDTSHMTEFFDMNVFASYAV